MIERRFRQAAAIASLLVATAFAVGPCTSDMVEEFREVASDDVAAGLKNIADGVIDGMFSALDPGDDEITSGSIGTTPGQSSNSSSSSGS